MKMNKIGVTFFMIGCLTISVSSCSDDDVEPVKEQMPLLTKIFRNGIVQLELFYAVDKKLYRTDFYSGGTLATYTFYDYDEMGIKESKRYKAEDHSLDYRSVFTLDNFGRVVKAENYSEPDFGEIASIRQFNYNPAGQLIRRDFRIPGSPVYLREDFTYDDDNNLIRIQHTTKPTEPDKFMSYQADYLPGDQSIPETWEDYVFILGLSGVDGNIRNMFIDNTHAEYWDSDHDKYLESILESSGRTFDEEGNLIRQVLTSKNILKPENPDVVVEMTYEYTN